MFGRVANQGSGLLRPYALRDWASCLSPLRPRSWAHMADQPAPANVKPQEASDLLSKGYTLLDVR